jgi:hypothetical protein
MIAVQAAKIVSLEAKVAELESKLTTHDSNRTSGSGHRSFNDTGILYRRWKKLQQVTGRIPIDDDDDD